MTALLTSGRSGQNLPGGANAIAGLTEPLLADGLDPEPVPPEPFSGQMYFDRAIGS